MGSKMASASRVVQVVKPHAPLIRFPDRRDNPKLSASEALRSAGLPSHSSITSQHSKGSISPDLLMHPGPPDTAEILKTLPQKYRRKPISQEEMEFIQVCCLSSAQGCAEYHDILALQWAFADLHILPFVCQMGL
ncbi:Mrps36 [Phodopus roborovskii]|uniref:Mrps36 protein n=1 Tax=Phodopus roborovskii TaxID=109678 RepID=A0AAU9Z6X8_PHORO|nr:Mrps36 [Phodopus roborovskii]